MNDFFELARSRGFFGDSTRKPLSGLRKAGILDFVIEASFSLPFYNHGAINEFGFLANSSLSGGPNPCSEMTCRLAQADRLARFAALYADHVVIQNPFTRYSPDASVDLLRSKLTDDIAIMGYFEPLIRSGLVSVTQPGLALCTDCAKKFEAQRERLTILLAEAADEVFDRFTNRITVKREKTGYFGIYGPEEIVIHGAQFILPPKEFPYKGRMTRRCKETLIGRLISPIIEDVYEHHIHSRHTSFNYLTNREIDLGIIRHIGGAEVRRIDRSLAQGLAHSVPIVENAEISEILRLREAEPEAFAVYRNAISSVLREADLSTPEAVKAAFMTKIHPELAKIDLVARNACKISRRAAAKEIVISTAAVSIGMLVGTVQPSIGAVLAALGGINAVRTLADKVADMFYEPPIVRGNSFYFLWKLRQKRNLTASKIYANHRSQFAQLQCLRKV